MKGITPVIAIILLLLITISMVGFAFVWFTRMAETAAAGGTEALNATIGMMSQKVKIESIKQENVSMRNVGTQTIPSSSLSFYINGTRIGCDGNNGGSAPAGNNIDSFTLAPSEVRECYMCTGTSGNCVGMSVCSSNGKLKIISSGNTDEYMCP